eukprot:273986_1
MDWEELSPLTNEQLQCVSELQERIVKLAPIVRGIDKTQIKMLEPSELSSLPSNHKLRARYNQIYVNKHDEDDDDDECKYMEKPGKLNYIEYFGNQMRQQRKTRLQLTSNQQQCWNYLTRHANYLRNVLDSIQNLQNVMKKVNSIYSENEAQCQHIHNKCMHLIQEQKELEEEAKRLKSMLQYFCDYNQIRARIHSPKLTDVLSADFHHIVIRINECIAFLTNHLKEYAESEEYLSNYKILRNQCIHLMKNYVQQRLQRADKNSKKNENDNETNILEFRAAASTLRPLMKLIEDEAATCEEYAALLNEIQKLILNERHNTLKEFVDATIAQYAKTRDTPNLIRASSSYVMMICLREYQLFNEFFDLDLTLKKSLLSTVVHRRRRRRSRSSSSSSAISHSLSMSPTRPPPQTEEEEDENIVSGAKRISGLIRDLCHLLYSYLRPFIIQTSSMQTLCDVIHILQGEIQEHMQLQRSNITTTTSTTTDDDDDDDQRASNIPEFDATIVRIIEDAQERLVFRTQIHLRDQIQHYEVKQKDLNYYELLQGIYGGGEGADDEEKVRYSDWCPILEGTLSVLSKIYPVLNHSVFEFLAYEAVSCCVTSLVDLARKLALQSSSVHGHLFLIKHLLILREQITPFDVDFSITETTLDFGHMTQYLSDLVGSTSKYSLVEVFQHAIPTVNKQQLNSKKSMESVLKKGCEAFIETQTNLLIGPLIQVIAKYKQQSAINKLRKQHEDKMIHPLSPPPPPAHTPPPTDKATLLTELNAILISCQQGLINRINQLMQMMKLYLQNQLTQRILLKPIISNVQSAFIQLRKIVSETALQNEVKLDICDEICDQLQAIVTKTNR